MNIGIPTEVSLYHPAEYIELSKPVLAFLDINLEEMKGGVRNQLLVGHIVHYIQNNGLEGLTRFPRYRREFRDELVSKLNDKGIDLNDLNSTKLNLNWEKANNLSSPSAVYQPDDLFDKYSNVFTSSNYSMFHLLPFNRKIISRHVATIKKSMIRNGITSFPLMIYTNCIDKTWKYWIVDGQHRFQAFRELGLPIRFTLHQSEDGTSLTREDIVRLVADVNITSRRWGIKDFLHAWESLGVREYLKLKSVYEKTRISMTTLLQAYSGHSKDRATFLFTTGSYKMEDEKNGDTYITYLTRLKSVIPKSSALDACLLDFFKKHEKDYDNTRMYEVLKKEKSAILGDSKEEIYANLEKVYFAEAA